MNGQDAQRAVEGAVSDFLEGIAAGFELSRWELIGVVVVAVLVLGVLVAAFVVITSRERRKRREYSRRIYDSIVESAGLDPEERAFLDLLAAVPHIIKPAERHRLVKSPSAFNKALERYAESHELFEELVASLRFKLGLMRYAPDKPLRTSAELPRGLPLYVTTFGGWSLHAKVRDKSPDWLEITTPQDSALPAENDELLVYFHTEGGIFSFLSKVQQRRGATLRIAHSENLLRAQNRQFYRRKLSVPVGIKKAGSDEKPETVRSIDLGGGGASLVNPQRRFRKGQSVELFIETRAGRRLKVTGSVIRTSSDGEVLHIEFDRIPESHRDRIIGYILNKTK